MEDEKVRIPVFVHGPTKPDEVPGFKWVPKRHVDKRNLVVGWRRVAATPDDGEDGGPPPFPDEESEPQKPTLQDRIRHAKKRGNYNADLTEPKD